MALIKDIETPFGITATYHNIGKIRVEKDSGYHIRVDSYISQEARENEAEPIMSTSFFCDWNNINVEQPLLSQLYNWLKTQDPFQGAEDA